jgi:hypothetical protein
MSSGAFLRAMSLMLSLGPVWVGCSSWDEDTPDHLDFALPTMAWTLSVGDPQWRKSPGPDVEMPRFLCAGGQALSSDCCARGFDCQTYPLACDPDTRSCALTFDVEMATTIDLAVVASVAAAHGRVFADVDLVDMEAVIAALAGWPFRSARLFLGPANLAASSEPSAILVSSVDLFEGGRAVHPEAAALSAFAGFARDYQTPFNLLLSLHVVVPNGGVAPPNPFRMSLTGNARAYY